MKKVFLVVLVISCFLFSSLSVSALADNPIKVNIDGKEISFDINPQSVNGRTMVPLRKIVESLNVEISWDEASQTITGKKDGLTFVLKIDNPVAAVNGKVVRLDTPATVINGRTLVPVRFLAEITGADVSWDDTTNTVLINTTNTEKLIKLALTSEETYVFQIQDDYDVRATSASTTRNFNTNEIATGTPFGEDTAKTWLKAFIATNNIIRVNADTVSMDKDNYECELNVLEGNNGIKIDISGDKDNVHYFGIIKGNTMSVSGGVGMSSVMYGVGNSLSVGGELTVGIKVLDKEHQPPLPVRNLQSKRNSDKSVLISWEDPNPTGLIESYDIYRIIDNEEELKVASVTSGFSWTDTSEEAKPDLDKDLSYFIIVHAKNGMDSIRGDYAFQSLDDIFQSIDDIFDENR